VERIKKEMTQKRNSEKNESESYDVAVYIGILSFLWSVPCRSVRILVGGILFLGIHFLISWTLIRRFIMESAPLTVQDLAK